MTDAREEILGRIRGAVTEQPRSKAQLELVSRRVSTSTPSVQPETEEPLLRRFCEKHTSVHGTYERVTDSTQVPGAVLHHHNAYEIAPELLVGKGCILDGINWPNDVTPRCRPATIEDRVAVSEAFAGIAETGTLVLLSGDGRPTSHNFLPDDHLVLLDAGRIVRYQEDIWTLLRAMPENFPRAVNLITGPSKTADVEQTVQYGAHGPRRLHVIIVEG